MVKVEDVEGGRGLLGGGTEPVYGRRGNRHRKVPSNTYGGQLPIFRKTSLPTLLLALAPSHARL